MTEPMTLGSPTQSPKFSNPQFLPAFLTGDQPTTSTPRNSIVTPIKNQRFLLNSGLDTPDHGLVNKRESLNLIKNHDSPLFSKSIVEKTGPPTLDLFEILESKHKYEKKNDQSYYGTPLQSKSSFLSKQNLEQSNEGFNNSYMTNDISMSQRNFDQSHASTSFFDENAHLTNRNNWDLNKNPNVQNEFEKGKDDSHLWVTIFGFTPQETNSILTRFSQFGTIIEKKFPSKGGNWMHIKYSTPYEVNNALSLNGKILPTNTMIGVLPYKQTSTNENKENRFFNNSKKMVGATPPTRVVRPLVVQSPTTPSRVYSNLSRPDQLNNSMLNNSIVAEKSNGILSKAFEYVFGMN